MLLILLLLFSVFRLDLTAKKPVTKKSENLSPVTSTKQEVEKPESPPPLPPKPSHLVKPSQKSPALSGVIKSPSVNLPATPSFSSSTSQSSTPAHGGSAVDTSSSACGGGEVSVRSRTTSDSRLESDSSLSDGDDIMLQVELSFLCCGNLSIDFLMLSDIFE